MARSNDEAMKYRGRLQAVRPKVTRTRTQYLPFWLTSMAHWYSLRLMLVIALDAILGASSPGLRGCPREVGNPPRKPKLG